MPTNPTDPAEERGSYDPTKIGQPTRDRMRSLLGDTGIATDESGGKIWLLSDVELEALLGGYPRATPGRHQLATAEAADMLVARFAQSPDAYRDEGGVAVEWKHRISAWTNLATRLRAEAGGIRSERVGPTFALGQMVGPDLSLLR